MKHFIYSLLAIVAFALVSCGEQKIEPANPPISFKEYKSSYNYIHNLPLDGCFEVTSVGAVVNNREGYQLDAEISFTVNVKMVKALSHKPKEIASYDYDNKVTLQYLDKDNNVIGETESGVKSNILDLSVGQMGTVTGSVVTTKEDAQEILKKTKYVRIINLCACYEDEEEKNAYEEGERARRAAEEQQFAEASYESDSDDWNSILDSYEQYVNNYVRLMRKASAGDASALAEYGSMLQEAQELSRKLSNAQGELSSAQWSRYLSITNKMTSL